MNNLFRIGISLPTSFLNDHYIESAETWYKMFGSSRECLNLLAEQGVKSIEINDLHESPPLEDIEPAIEQVLKNGFNLTVHIFLPDFKQKRELPVSLQRVCRVINKYNLGKSSIPLTLHSHRVADDLSREEVKTQTVADLRVLAELLSKEGLILPLDLEICRDKKGGPVGVTYREILDMVNQVEDIPIGVCWDMGHTLYNIDFQGWEDPFPPEEFLARLTHTHIHDLDPVLKKTHWPLRGDNDLLNKFIDLLKGNDYQGVYNFELYPQLWQGSFEERKNRILNSIELLTALLS